jgi:hypothetical protein
MAKELEIYEVTIIRDTDTRVAIVESWKLNHKLHREGAPASIDRDPTTGAVTSELWSIDNKTHREDGPAYLRREVANGRITYSEWFHHGDKIKPPRRPQPRTEAPKDRRSIDKPKP